MGNRLSKIYTRTGDDGTTGLSDGSRVSKYSARVEGLGTVDELNSHIGLLRAAITEDSAHQALLSAIQHDLFDLGGELASPGFDILKPDRVDGLEQSLDQLNADLPPLKNFILPAGSEAVARSHLARAVCRRAERCLFAMAASEPVRPHILQYVNRLSDLLFVLARRIARDEGSGEVLWEQQRPEKS